MIVLGLDIGTTGVKAVAFGEAGEAVASAQVQYPLVTPRTGCYELDPGRMEGAIWEVVGRVAAAVGPGRIQALACSALGEAVLPVDGEGRPLYNTVLALDHRATRQVEALRRRISPEEFFRVTGQSFHPIASLFKILWWRDNEPEVFRQAARFLCWNDMLGLLLGCEPAISPSLAARTGLYGLAEGGWSERLLELAGLQPDRLARVLPAGQVVGQVAKGRAEELGLARECLYVSGGWDQACAALGSGGVAEGIVVDSMGSTDSLNATYRGINTSPAMLQCHFSCTPGALPPGRGEPATGPTALGPGGAPGQDTPSAPGLYLTNAFSLGGGNLLGWFRDNLDAERAARLEAEGRSYYQELAAEALRSDRSALVLPHFAGSGTPAMDPASLGAIAGLTLATERRDIALGILEGIAFEMALNLEALREAGVPVATIYAGSGGARSRELVQLRSDVFGLPITPLLVEEAGCLACALLCRTALEPFLEPADLARQWVRLGEPVEPRAGQMARYREKREAYARLYPALAEINRRLRKLDCRGGGEG
jgi:xylulokinase